MQKHSDAVNTCIIIVSTLSMSNAHLIWFALSPNAIFYEIKTLCVRQYISVGVYCCPSYQAHTIQDYYGISLSTHEKLFTVFFYFVFVCLCAHVTRISTHCQTLWALLFVFGKTDIVKFNKTLDIDSLG